MRAILALFLISVLLTGCATVSPSREFVRSKSYREAYVSKHPELSAGEKEAIRQARIPSGMKPEAVTGLLGEPNRKYTSGTGLVEIWYYDVCYVGFTPESRTVSFGRY